MAMIHLKDDCNRRKLLYVTIGNCCLRGIVRRIYFTLVRREKIVEKALFATMSVVMTKKLSGVYHQLESKLLLGSPKTLLLSSDCRNQVYVKQLTYDTF